MKKKLHSTKTNPPQTSQTSMDIVDQVMKQILNDEIKMKPRSYFIIGSVMMASGLVVFFLLAVFFFNHFFFYLDRTGWIDFWRMRGFSHILWQVFPWWSLVLAGVFVILGAWLVHQYDISYKKNYKLIVLGMILIAGMFGYWLNTVGINHLLLKHGVTKRLYHYQQCGNDWLVGRVIKVISNHEFLVESSGKQIVVLIDNQTKMPKRQIELGQTLRAVGEFTNQNKTIFKATAIGFGRSEHRR